MKPLELYIHIPFCVKKCEYCDFLSAPADEQTKERYVVALKKEIEMWAAEIDRNEYFIKSIFFGGGTPSILKEKQLCGILELIGRLFCGNSLRDAEITVECNPGTLNTDKLKAYRKAGVNRLSIGLQSANDRELKALGRIHSWEQFLESYHTARECGFENINVDLMSALPGQTMKSYEETLRKVLALSPEHISAYSLIIEEGTPFFERYGNEGARTESISDRSARKSNIELLEYDSSNTYDKLPDEDTEREMYQRTEELLAEHGYERYEISNYSKPGKQCIHNIGYWKRVEYLGFGIGAAGLFREKRYTNTSDLAIYCERLEQNLLLERTEQVLTKEEQMEEFMFLGLRMTQGVSVKEFEQIFQRDIETVYGEVLKKHTRQGLLERHEELVYLTKKGLDVSNVVMADFLLS